MYHVLRERVNSAGLSTESMNINFKVFVPWGIGYRTKNRTIYTQTFVPPSGGPAGALVFNQGADYLWYKNGSPVSFDIGTNDFTLEFYIKYETELGPGAVIFILGDPDNIGGGNNLALSKTNGDPNIDIAFPIAMGPTFSADPT